MVALPDEVEVQRIELLGLDQHLLPHADLSEIVEQPRVADLFDLFAGESDGAIGPVLGAVDHAGQSHGHVRDSSRVTERGRVPLLDRMHRGLHEPLEQSLDFFVQPAVLDRDRRLSRERGHELHGAPRVRYYLVLHVRRRGEYGFGVALAVDELEDADHFFLVILHGEDEHRLRAVAVALVERAVDAVFHVRRQEVGIVDHERLAGHRRVPRETRAVHRDRELDERRVGLGVRLRDPEAQPLLALVARLDEVETARVRGGNPSRLREDELEQGFQVPLGAEGDADARQLADLAAAVGGLGSGAGGLHAGGGFPIPRPYRDQQLPRPDRRPHEAGE